MAGAGSLKVDGHTERAEDSESTKDVRSAENIGRTKIRRE